MNWQIIRGYYQQVLFQLHLLSITIDIYYKSTHVYISSIDKLVESTSQTVLENNSIVNFYSLHC